MRTETEIVEKLKEIEIGQGRPIQDVRLESVKSEKAEAVRLKKRKQQQEVDALCKKVKEVFAVGTAINIGLGIGTGILTANPIIGASVFSIGQGITGTEIWKKRKELKWAEQKLEIIQEDAEIMLEEAIGKTERTALSKLEKLLRVKNREKTFASNISQVTQFLDVRGMWFDDEDNIIDIEIPTEALLHEGAWYLFLDEQRKRGNRFIGKAPVGTGYHMDDGRIIETEIC